MKKLILLIVIYTAAITTHGQYTDTVFSSKDSISEPLFLSIQETMAKINERGQRIKSLVLPTALISYGFIALESDGLKSFDNQIKNEIWTKHPHIINNIDNYLQFAPAASVYMLNAIGIKGRNNFRDRTMICFMSNAMMGVTVKSLKAITKVPRPDGSGTNAFPSGHTASAFASAEFLRQEYKDVSPWYGIAGYAAAITTAYFRMYNNRHWFRDVVPAAGIGIISTKVAYWIYPAIKKKLFKHKEMNTLVMPAYQNGSFGVGLVHRF